MAEHRIWFDCDTGVDDAIALLTAHRQPGLEIVGLSTVAGNVTLDHTTENTLKICGLMGAVAASADIMKWRYMPSSFVLT